MQYQQELSESLEPELAHIRLDLLLSEILHKDESAKANGLNPYKYLLHLLKDLPAVITKEPKADTRTETRDPC